jgi:hypothetical protein
MSGGRGDIVVNVVRFDILCGSRPDYSTVVSIENDEILSRSLSLCLSQVPRGEGEKREEKVYELGRESRFKLTIRRE